MAYQIAEVAILLGVTPKTVEKRMKKLGITKQELSESDFKLIKSLGKKRDSKEKIIKSANAWGKLTAAEKMTVHRDDPLQIADLKKNYNANKKIIKYCEDKIIKLIKEDKVPDKNYRDMHTTYQKTNRDIIKTLREMQEVKANEDDLFKRLGKYL